MVLNSMKPKTVNYANSLTCLSEQERRKSGGKSQNKWLISLDPQKHNWNASVVCIKASAIPTM